MKSLRKNSKYKFPDSIVRKIVDVERKRGNNYFSNSDYCCYYVDIPFDNGDIFFEKYSEFYEEILYLNFGIHTPQSKYIKK